MSRLPDDRYRKRQNADNFTKSKRYISPKYNHDSYVVYAKVATTKNHELMEFKGFSGATLMQTNFRSSEIRTQTLNV
jgi:hypothetical protein